MSKDWNVYCPWCGVHRGELTGRCGCGRTPIKPEKDLIIK